MPMASTSLVLARRASETPWTSSTAIELRPREGSAARIVIAALRPMPDFAGIELERLKAEPGEEQVNKGLEDIDPDNAELQELKGKLGSAPAKAALRPAAPRARAGGAQRLHVRDGPRHGAGGGGADEEISNGNTSSIARR